MAKSFVLNFHNETNSVLFEEMIIALKSRYQLVSIQQLEELLSQGKKIKNICHISFDDGERSFYNIIYPILKKHSVPVSLFISPQVIMEKKNFWFQEIKGYDEAILKQIIADKFSLPIKKINSYSCEDIFKALRFTEVNDIIGRYQQQTDSSIKTPCNMSVAEVIEVESSGLVTIGAHTLQHPILKNETDDDSYNEIAGSIKMLQNMLGHSIKYFAYPNGRPGIDLGEREMAYLKHNGITLAFSTELSYLFPNVNKLSVPRMGFARMGLAPSNPLIYFRLGLGKNWIDIKSLAKPSEKNLRKAIRKSLNFEQ